MLGFLLANVWKRNVTAKYLSEINAFFFLFVRKQVCGLPPVPAQRVVAAAAIRLRAAAVRQASPAGGAEKVARLATKVGSSATKVGCLPTFFVIHWSAMPPFRQKDVPLQPRRAAGARGRVLDKPR